MSAIFTDGCVGDGACDVDDGDDNNVGEADIRDNGNDNGDIWWKQTAQDGYNIPPGSHHRTNTETPRDFRSFW